MKLKVTRYITPQIACKWIMYFTMINALGLLKPIGEIMPIFGFDYAIRWTNNLLIFFGIVFLTMGQHKRTASPFIWAMVLLVCGTLFLRLGLDFARGENVYKELNSHCPYLHIALSIIVYDLLKEKEITLDELVDRIILLTMIAYALRAFIAAAYDMKGIRILDSIATEGVPDDYYRNGNLRVPAPCFGSMMIPLCYYRLVKSGTTKKKMWPIFCMVFVVIYNIYVTMSRAAVAFSVLEIIFCLFISKKSAYKDLLLGVAGVVCMVLLLNSGIVGHILDMFSITNAAYGYSNNIRFMEYPYFWKMYTDHFWIGNGLFKDGDSRLYYNLNGKLIGGLSDCGFLRSLVFMGFPMLVFYVVWLLGGLMKGLGTFKRKVDPSLRILVLGILVSSLLYVLLVDSFFAPIAYAVPYALAIPEFAVSRIRLVSLRDGNKENNLYLD